MTASSENPTWPPAPSDVEGLLSLLGTGSEPVEGGETSQVWRVAGNDGHALVVRIAAPDVDDAALRTQVAAARSLVAGGVPFANPRTTVVVPYGSLRATVWDDLGASAHRDYEAFGYTVRALHDLAHSPAFDRADVRDGLDGLPCAEGRDWIHDDFQDAVSTGLITMPEAALILPSLTTMDAFYDTLDAVTPSVVHDDLWEKNVVFTSPADGPGAVLLDPDNLAWGRPESDLAFIVRGAAMHRITRDDADAFASGYGDTLPDKETAELLALPHRLRWILTCARRRAWSSNWAQNFDDEINRHTHGWI